MRPHVPECAHVDRQATAAALDAGGTRVATPQLRAPCCQAPGDAWRGFGLGVALGSPRVVLAVLALLFRAACTPKSARVPAPRLQPSLSAGAGPTTLSGANAAGGSPNSSGVQASSASAADGALGASATATDSGSGVEGQAEGGSCDAPADGARTVASLPVSVPAPITWWCYLGGREAAWRAIDAGCGLGVAVRSKAQVTSPGQPCTPCSGAGVGRVVSVLWLPLRPLCAHVIVAVLHVPAAPWL